MKGLLLKDFYMAVKYCRMVLILAVFYMVIAALSTEFNLFYFMFPMILCSAVAISLFSYDEKSKWNQTCGATPCSKRDMVTVKYLDMLLCIALFIVLSALAWVARGLRMGGVDVRGLVRMMAVMLAAGLVSPCIMLPVVFRFGSEKGRIAYYVVIGLMFGALFLINSAAGEQTGAMTAMLPQAVYPLAALGALVLLGLSWMLSVRLYEGREGY